MFPALTFMLLVGLVFISCCSLIVSLFFFIEQKNSYTNDSQNKIRMALKSMSLGVGGAGGRQNGTWNSVLPFPCLCLFFLVDIVCVQEL